MITRSGGIQRRQIRLHFTESHPRFREDKGSLFPAIWRARDILPGCQRDSQTEKRKLSYITLGKFSFVSEFPTVRVFQITQITGRSPHTHARS